MWTLQAGFFSSLKKPEGTIPPHKHTYTHVHQNNYHFMEELANCYHFCDIKRLRANTQRNNKILKGPWNINVNPCYICLLLIELLPRMWALWRIICQCKTSNGPIYWLLQAVEFQQSLINLFRSESLETQWGELHSRGNISSFLKTRKSIFVVTLFGCNGE